MKQIIQDLGSGETRLLDVPRPATARGSLVIDTHVSLISVGTERMLVDFGKASLLSKARQQPDKVRQVLDKARTDGVVATIDAVRSKLAQPLPLGYSNVGVVSEVGAGVDGFSVGDRVLSNGPHAETVRVGQNLCARIPDGVPNETAVFAVVASIGLQGIRLAAPTIGERVVVMGVGLIGLLTVQILLANGCRVLAMDFDPDKLSLARKWGADVCNLADCVDPVSVGMAFSGGDGVDAVLITASTKSNDPVRNAARMSRKRGRIVLVGVTGLELARDDFYAKELSLQVSCSYGPGRYDPAYEDEGNDYPLGFVRWTEKRNFEAVLDLMASGRIDVSDMISRRVPIEEAPPAFQQLGDDPATLGVILDYAAPKAQREVRRIPLSASSNTAAAGRIGIVGAGNYASRILMPAMRRHGVAIGPIVTSTGLSGAIAAERMGASEASTDLGSIIDDPTVAAAVVATRHDTHAPMASRLLEAGKAVFVEKPLVIDREQLRLVRAAYDRACEATGRSVPLMVGFNRRFAPLVKEMKALLDRTSAPKSFVMTMNAGAIPPDVWIQDPRVGGGRIIGEACHMIDLMRYLVGHPIVAVGGQCMGRNGFEAVVEDKADILLRFADGSHGTVHYLANGSAAFPKERIEVYANGGILQLDNFKRMTGYGWKGFRRSGGWRQDKGQSACIAAFCDAVRYGGDSPIPTEEIFEVAERTLEVAELLRAQV